MNNRGERERECARPLKIACSYNMVKPAMLAESRWNLRSKKIESLWITFGHVTRLLPREPSDNFSTRTQNRE